jgi:hypothetical protein
MSVAQIAAAHAKRQVALAKRAARETHRLWRRVDPGNIASSWRQMLPGAVGMVATSQKMAAASSAGYVDDVAAALSADGPAGGRLLPSAFAGIASDGRGLTDLLEQPVLTALRKIAGGASPQRALASGAVELDMLVRTQLADAGRVADGVAVTVRPQMTGYVRMLVGKTCSRCLILAGRRYEWNKGFARHPRCDCRHVPVAEDVPDDVRTDPRAHFNALDTAAQDKLLGKAAAQAARDGADLSQLVNARSGMTAAGTTLAGTSKSGLAGRRLRGAARLMPEEIYRVANGDRDEAVRLLRLHAYII